jgi:hypothetical protein
MLYCHTIEGHDGCTDRCRNIRTRSDKAAVLQTATDSVAPMNSCLRARREPIGAVSLFFAMGKIRGTPRLRSHISAHRATTKSSEQVLCFQKNLQRRTSKRYPACLGRRRPLVQIRTSRRIGPLFSMNPNTSLSALSTAPRRCNSPWQTCSSAPI